MRAHNADHAFWLLVTAVQTARSALELDRFQAVARAHYTGERLREIEAWASQRAAALAARSPDVSTPPTAGRRAAEAAAQRGPR